MATPEKFFNVNSDIKPGSIPKDEYDEHQVRRPDHSPRSDKDFQKILDRKDDRPTKDTNEVAKEGQEEKDRVAKKDPNTTKGEKKEAFVKETTQPDLDPRFNQAPTVDKDSKVAPKLGKEMSAAPSEEPRAMGYVEGPSKEEGKVTVPGDKLAQKGNKEVDADNIVKAMPAEKQAMKLPKDQAPDHLAAQKQASDAASALNERSKSKAANSEKALADLSKADKKAAKADLREQSNVNLMSGEHGAQQGLANAAGKVQAGPSTEKAYQVIQQIADQLSVVTTDGKSDTTITLKNIPQFEGVQVTVTTYPTARGEINVTFENLTQEGKMILDMADNRAALKQALDQKGYITHMITTSTTTVERTFAESGGAQREGQGGTRDEMSEGGGDQQQQDENQENEGEAA